MYGPTHAANFLVPTTPTLGTDGLPAATMPGIEEPAMGTMGYHIRRGGHGVTDYDWQCYMDFADCHLNK